MHIAHTLTACITFICCLFLFKKNGQCVCLADHEYNGRKDGNVACNFNEIEVTTKT